MCNPQERNLSWEVLFWGYPQIRRNVKGVGMWVPRNGLRVRENHQEKALTKEASERREGQNEGHKE